MAHVTGPLSTLPNHQRTPPQGMTCDEHPDRAAVRRVQGETDSFGSEQIDMCQECFDEHTAWRLKDQEERATTERHCEIHNGPGLNVTASRDPDEGSSGRLYDMCGKCRSRIMSAFIDGDER